MVAAEHKLEAVVGKSRSKAVHNSSSSLEKRQKQRIVVVIREGKLKSSFQVNIPETDNLSRQNDIKRCGEK